MIRASSRRLFTLSVTCLSPYNRPEDRPPRQAGAAADLPSDPAALCCGVYVLVRWLGKRGF